MENRENMEQQTNGAEIAPTFLQKFVEDIERIRNEIEQRPGQMEHFIAHGAMRRVREGNFSDYAMMKEQIAVRAADHVLNEMRERTQTKTVSREDFRNAKIAEKLIAFYHTRAKLFAEYAEVVDNKELSALALMMEKEFPYLKEVYETYMDEYTAPPINK